MTAMKFFRLASVALIAIVAFAFVSSLSSPQAAGSDEQNIRASVKDGIKADLDSYTLPSGAAPGRLNAAQQATLRSQITTYNGNHFAGQLKTDRLAAHLAWLDKVVHGKGAVYDQIMNTEKFSVDTVVIQGDSATATGTYTLHFKHAEVLDDAGNIATWGGRGTYSFTANLVRVSGSWMVQGLTSSEVDVQVDQSAFSGLDKIPAATKSFSNGSDSIPVLP